MNEDYNNNSTTCTSTDDRKSNDSSLQQQERDNHQRSSPPSIPLVKLDIQNITYEPLITTAAAAAATTAAATTAAAAAVQSDAPRRRKPWNKRHLRQSYNRYHQPPIVQRKTILRNVSPPPIEPYKLQAWMGPSGCGKTTLLSIASGVIEADSNRDPGAFPNSESRITINNDSRNLLRKKSNTNANVASASARIDASGRIDASDASGSYNGSNATGGSFPKGLIGVVWQDDLLLSNLTVRETIEFAAKLKTPSSSSSSSNSNNTKADIQNKVNQMVDQVLEDLSLTSIQHSLIGTTTASSSSSSSSRGISGGERKRVSVAQELVTRPSLIFLDEPTSGLDSTSALELMTTLKNLATNGGHSIVTIVHQPRTSIFDLFDGVLLLSQGEEVYSGPAFGIRHVLESCPIVGYRLPPMTNVADWIIDVIRKDESRTLEILKSMDCIDVTTTDGNTNDTNYCNGITSLDEEERPNVLRSTTNTTTDRCLPNHWLKTKLQLNTNMTTTTTLTTTDIKNNTTIQLSTMTEIQNSIPKYMASFKTQLELLTRRTIKQTRGERISTATFITQSAYIIFETTLWFRLKDDTNHIYERNSLLFFFIIAQATGLVTQSVTIFRRDYALVSRERSKKMYRVLPYYFAKTLAEMTTTIILPMVHVIIVYWTTNLRSSLYSFVMFLLIFYLTLTSAQSIGFILSAALPSLQLALIITPAISIFLFIMGGFYIPFSNMSIWVSWIKWLSFATYAYSGLLITEYEDRFIPCADEVSVSIGIGGSSSSSSSECPALGNDVLKALGVTGLLSHLWFNVFMLIVLQIACRWGAYILLRRSS